MAGEKILVVEDNRLNLELATWVLQDAGYTVLSAGDGERGLDLARTEQPALVLMDLTLPGLDGLSAVGLLKANPATRHIPVVALTAHALAGDEARALAAGCAGYLTKPIDTRAFAGQVARFVGAPPAVGRADRPAGEA